jgi:hypothetical protein
MDALMRLHHAGLLSPGQFWLSIPRFPNYLIGVHGSVVSLVKKKPRVLRPIRLGNYIGFQLLDAQGRCRKAYLHRLVAEAVHGPCPAGMECCHSDGEKSNNDFTNLRWDTKAANEADRIAHGATAAGERSGTVKLSWVTVRAMRRMRQETGAFYSAIADQFGVSTMTAYRAVTGQSWRD